ncbi:hypothetical protein KFL_005500050 [Klebsormidium nitens]|uniref:Nuclear cap-binding protein subunit 3 n=1 Tax=Klebsormidium nitens TaxID=105231 RepID=A0A1Y1IHX7_KLENI|nr:hypothetical protein KFL_005500050 [Klebsormidium nitens]|eukprot:GAQ89682.1 hypothetical protein KFL_005500050 [Klebsormidium nitens]
MAAAPDLSVEELNGDAEVANPEKKLPEPILFGAQESLEKSAVQLEQEKHQARARKFGVEYVEPRKDLLLSRAELRTQIARERAGDRKGFAVGIDLFSEEEKAKKERRAQRYGLATAAKDETDEERKRRLRAERFGAVEPEPAVEGATMDVDALEVRRDAPDTASLRLDTIYVYGTDTLSTKDVLRYFTGYGPSFVEWINDSSCNIVFEDEFAAKRALLTIGTQEPGSANEALPAPWYAGKPFERDDLRLPLSLRIACTADVKPEEGVVSRHLWIRDGGRGQGRGRGGGRGRGASRRERGDWQHEQQSEEVWGQEPVAVQEVPERPLGPRKRLRNDVEPQPGSKEPRQNGKSRNRKRGKVSNTLAAAGQGSVEKDAEPERIANPRFDRRKDDEDDD